MSDVATSRVVDGVDLTGVDDLDVEVIIAAARAGQRRRQRFAATLIAATVVLAGSIYGIERALTDPGSSGHSPRGSITAGVLSGTWHVHPFYLVLDANGIGTFRWPIGVLCGHGAGKGPPPCDTWTPSTSIPSNGQSPQLVGEIHDGGNAQITIINRTGRLANGIVKSSTDPATLPDGPITLRLFYNDVLYLTPASKPTGPSPPYLCGPDAKGVNCGA